MSETNTSSVTPVIDELILDAFDDSNLLFSEDSNKKYTDSRRRLEDKLEQRFLEKDVREFDFDI